MEENNIKKLYRIQSFANNIDPYTNRNVPIKRVSISNDGKIVFNPNSDQFIYFSPTDRHHCYYIFNKVLKIITDELSKAKNNPYYKKLNIPEDFRAFTYFTHTSIDVIKEVQKFFENYIPPKYVELVSLNYLSAFSDMFKDCSIKNVKKTFGSRCPEISDTAVFGGAYGVNDAWLDLLKASTLSTETARLSVTRFLDFIIENSYKTTVKRQQLKQVLARNENLFQILDFITYNKLNNPDFYAPNNTNNIRRHLQAIEDYKLFNDKRPRDKIYFAHQKQVFKEALHSAREKDPM